MLLKRSRYPAKNGSPGHLRRLWSSLWFALVLGVAVLASGCAQTQEMHVPPSALKKLSVEELMAIEVTSVSKRPEKLSETASAIQVITQEDIRRSSATNLPEALQLSPNLHVELLNSYAWLITSRGFKAPFANKLLVMIDGRTVYSPLFAGVFWDVQNTLLEDLDRIEVISGPGGTLWGTNAVNGVINVVSRPAAETQGLYVSAAAGTHLQHGGALRYGGTLGQNLHFRVFAQRQARNHLIMQDGSDASDAWSINHGGFRVDWQASEADAVTVQGALYGGTEQTLPEDSEMNGQHLLARWTHRFSPASDLRVQAYVDRTWRNDQPTTVTDELETYDLEFQHRFPAGARHGILWGAGYRLMVNDMATTTDLVGFLPPHRNMHRFNGFVQDDFALVHDRLQATIGTKLEHNDFAGFALQPSARLAWTPDTRQTVWGAVSRAVRSPSRIDVDYHLPTYSVPPDMPSVAGGPNFVSEKLTAYELGYRVRPAAPLLLSLATFYNRYDDLYSVEALPGTLTFQIQNGTEGTSWGVELSGTYQPLERWQLRGGYTHLQVDLRSKPGRDFTTFDLSTLANDPSHRFLLQSALDLPGRLQFDVTGFYVSEHPEPRLPAYADFNVRLAWALKGWEVAVAGQNILADRQSELGLEIPRSVYGKLTWRY